MARAALEERERELSSLRASAEGQGAALREARDASDRSGREARELRQALKWVTPRVWRVCVWRARC